MKSVTITSGICNEINEFAANYGLNAIDENEMSNALIQLKDVFKGDHDDWT